MFIIVGDLTKEKWQITHLCGSLEVEFTGQEKSISITFFGSILDTVVGHEMFSFLDGYNGYNQVKMVEKDKEKTSFISEWGAYAYNVMPFGLCNVTITFQKVITQTFKKYLMISCKLFWTISMFMDRKNSM
jgi:hypothetical protein